MLLSVCIWLATAPLASALSHLEPGISSQDIQVGALALRRVPHWRMG